MTKSLPQRKSPRLQGYDYAQSGAYFVTICCWNRKSFFGHVANAEMHLNETGMFAAEAWQAIPQHFPSVDIDLWVIMPNHMHGILVLTDWRTRSSASLPSTSNSQPTQPTPPLGRIISNYKGEVTRRERQRRDHPDFRVWQSRYHDHIIRDDSALNRIREYVLYNPARWADDTYFDDVP